jgi:hypothetical protein
VGSASAAGSAGSAGALLSTLMCSLLLAAVGSWSRLVLLLDGYRSSLFVALLERPG